MKHSYLATCDCARCSKERIRRNVQANRTSGAHYAAVKARRTRKRESRRPAVGSQEWAETRGDDIDSESGDY